MSQSIQARHPRVRRRARFQLLRGVCAWQGKSSFEVPIQHPRLRRPRCAQDWAHRVATGQIRKYGNSRIWLGR